MNNYVLETSELSKYYGPNLVVDSVNLHVKKGEIYGLLGRNGAGKTTIMKLIMGLVQITKGEVYAFGKDITKEAKYVYPRIGCLIESPGFYPNMSAYENLQIFAELRGSVHQHSVKDALEIVGLSPDSKKTFSKFSLGMKQRLGVAHAIMNEPELLILDEPTNGLDPIGIAEIRSFLKQLSVERDISILISSHQLSEIERIVDSIGIIQGGNLLEEHDYRELLRRNKKFIQLEVSDVQKAMIILEQKLGTDSISIENAGVIRVNNTDVEPRILNRMLNENGVYVNEIFTSKMNLENYFREVTGGEGIA